MAYLHEHNNFKDLLNILADEMKIEPGLVEKDYWIMHVLYGLKKQKFQFELKGGTSLSKGFKIIDRFSEDIDIHIKPAEKLNVQEDPKKTRSNDVDSRKNFYDWLKEEINIDGIIRKIRDHVFDNATYTSGGIRLFYEPSTEAVDGAKDGILLEAGFDTVTPNTALTISSWAYDRAIETVEINDNRAIDIICYHPGYTFVEKLQTIATKFRQEQADGKERANLMRQYYDVSQLLKNDKVLQFIATDDYYKHKQTRFPKKDLDIPIAENEAFLLSPHALRKNFEERYKKTAKLYYKGQPDFNDLLANIHRHIDKL